MVTTVRVVQYLNQFFGGIDGEEEVEVDYGRPLLGAASELAEAVHPGVGPLNGLITIDNFRLTRHVCLSLRWRSRGGTPPRAADSAGDGEAPLPSWGPAPVRYFCSLTAMCRSLFTHPELRAPWPSERSGRGIDPAPWSSSGRSSAMRDLSIASLAERCKDDPLALHRDRSR